MNPSYLRWLQWAAIGIGGLVLAFALALASTYVYLAPSLPTAQSMREKELAVPLRVYSSSGELISQIGEQRRIPVTFEDIPPLVRQAVLAAEDDRFFEHSGLDWMGVTRSIVANVLSAGAGQGGSTITQQAARNMFLSLDKTLRRKLSEVFVTYRMERDFTKEQILATYLNVILFGQRSYGIAAAAETYYGRRLDELTVAQAATLAGIIQRPSDQNPVTSPKNAERRRAYVLRRMRELGYIDQATADAAAKEPVGSRGYAPLVDVEAEYVAELVRQELIRLLGESAVNNGYKVFTTIDGRLQEFANRAVRLGLLEYDRRHGYRGPLAKVEIPAAAEAVDLDELLGEHESISLLQPAVVTTVGATHAEVHIRELGKARINWDGLSWARRTLRNGLGANPTKASDVVARGDVIFVVTDERGNAQLAQLPQAQAALVALNPIDGAVVAMVGGFNFHTNKFNRVTQARRQPGSGFKPLIYSAALDNGFTAATTILNAPVVRDETGSEEHWRPQNSGGEIGGPTRLRDALARSLNHVSIRILQSPGMLDASIAHAGKFGIRTDTMPRNLSLALGTLSVSPVEMATGFAVFANGGFKVEPYWISRIEDSAGNVVYQAAPVYACAECEHPPMKPAPPPPPLMEMTADNELMLSAPVAVPVEPGAATVMAVPDAAGSELAAAPAFVPKFRGLEDAPPSLRELASLQGGAGFLPPERIAPRVVSAQNAWLMADILHDATTIGTARRTRALGRNDLAGKTGTTQDSRDAWFNGFTANLVASVWMGFDNDQSLGRGEEGSSAAVPVWMHFMREALRATPESRPERPAGLVEMLVSRVTGNQTFACDPEAMTEYFMPDTLPEPPGPAERRCVVQEEGGAPGAGGGPLF